MGEDAVPGKLPKSELRPETKKVITEAADKILRSVGLPTLSEAYEKCKTIVGEGAAQSDEQRYEAVLKKWSGDDLLPESEKQELHGVVTVLVIRDYIEKMPEPSPEEFNALVEQFGNFPFLLRGAMGTMDHKIKSVKRDLPRKAGGGRRSSLTLDQKKDACLRVGLLMGKGVAFPDALVRVGRRFGVGPKTIQRAWQKRAQLHNDIPPKKDQSGDLPNSG
jgi:hypothetical protein